jgi:hypothetical protein
MKKTLSFSLLMAGMLLLASSQASAAPVVDGFVGVHPSLGAGAEWANTNFPAGSAYPYYLEVFDPNEADNVVDNMDISHVVLLQELTACGIPASCAPFSSGDGDFSNDGIYLLIETYTTPPSLDPVIPPPTDTVFERIPEIKMSGDLLGDGLNDLFNVFLRHSKNPVTLVHDVEVCVGSQVICSVDAFYTPLTGIGGAFALGSVLEYFIPSGTLGTPPASPFGTQFPLNFVGTISYDNGIADLNGDPTTRSADDAVLGTIAIPEPSTMAMVGLGAVLGLAGLKRRFV